MLNLKCRPKGDTLIEVTIAIGIFTLVAISAVAVVNITSSGAQSALENTLTREEVDAQAEAIRFIQSSFDTDSEYADLSTGSGSVPNSKNNLYSALWNRIRTLADGNARPDSPIDDTLTEFTPSTCKDIYDDDKTFLINQNAFVVNLKKLNSYIDGDDIEEFIRDVIVAVKDKPDLFIPASTYPQISYSSDDSLLGDSLRNSILSDVEGIYVVGVPDINRTNIVSEDKETGAEIIESKSAYYDFYVRSCWYNSGSEVPSTVSTAVRLRNPEIIAYVEPPQTEIEDKPEPEDVTFENIEWIKYGDQQYNSCGPEPKAGEHVTFPDDTSIKLLGSTKSSVSLGAYYDKFSADTPFSLQVDINASNIGTHPSENGGFTVSFDIVDANGTTITQGIQASVSSSSKNGVKKEISIPGTSEKIVASSPSFTLLLEYSRGKFKGCITEPNKDQECISATKQIQAHSFLKVDYNLRHGSHCCSRNAHVELSNIQMRRSSTGTITF